MKNLDNYMAKTINIYPNLNSLSKFLSLIFHCLKFAALGRLKKDCLISTNKYFKYKK